MASQPLLSPSIPRFPPPRLHTRTPSRSPTRGSLADDILSDLSPATTLEAFTNPSGKLKASIEAATSSERAFAIRATVASKKIQEWVDELAGWPWPEEGGERGFEMPVAKRRKVGILEDKRGRNNDQETRGEEVEQEYIGSLLASSLDHYEDRIDDITADMEDLNVEDIKRQVLDTHFSPRSRPSSSASNAPMPSLLASYTRMDDFTAVVTATVLHSLPNLSRLMRLMDVWNIRLSVLRKITPLLLALDDAEIALKSGWTAILHPSQHLTPATETTEIHLSRSTFEVMRSVLQNKVTTLGQDLDYMLDTLEGRQDTLPEAWLDRMEAIENDYGSWVVHGDRKIREGGWARMAKARREEDDARKAREQEAAETARRKAEEEAKRRKAQDDADRAEAAKLEAEKEAIRLQVLKEAHEAEAAETATRKAEEEAEEVSRREAMRLAEEAEAARLLEEQQAQEAQRRAEDEAREVARQEALKIAAEAEATRLFTEQQAQDAKREADEAEAARLLGEVQAQEARRLRLAREAEEAEAVRLATEREVQVEADRVRAEQQAQEALRIAEETEAARLLTEQQAQEALRNAEETEAARLLSEKQAQEAKRLQLAREAEEAEMTRLAAEKEAQGEAARIQAEKEATEKFRQDALRLAAEAEATRILAEEQAQEATRLQLVKEAEEAEIIRLARERQTQVEAEAARIKAEDDAREEARQQSLREAEAARLRAEEQAREATRLRLIDEAKEAEKLAADKQAQAEAARLQAEEDARELARQQSIKEATAEAAKLQKQHQALEIEKSRMQAQQTSEELARREIHSSELAKFRTQSDAEDLPQQDIAKAEVSDKEPEAPTLQAEEHHSESATTEPQLLAFATAKLNLNEDSDVPSTETKSQWRIADVETSETDKRHAEHDAEAEGTKAQQLINFTQATSRKYSASHVAVSEPSLEEDSDCDICSREEQLLPKTSSRIDVDMGAAISSNADEGCNFTDTCIFDDLDSVVKPPISRYAPFDGAGSEASEPAIGTTLLDRNTPDLSLASPIRFDESSPGTSMSSVSPHLPAAPFSAGSVAGAEHDEDSADQGWIVVNSPSTSDAGDQRSGSLQVEQTTNVIDSSRMHSHDTSAISGYLTSEPTPDIFEAQPVEYFSSPVSGPISSTEDSRALTPMASLAAISQSTAEATWESQKAVEKGKAHVPLGRQSFDESEHSILSPVLEEHDARSTDIKTGDAACEEYADCEGHSDCEGYAACVGCEDDIQALQEPLTELEVLNSNTPISQINSPIRQYSVPRHASISSDASTVIDDRVSIEPSSPLPWSIAEDAIDSSPEKEEQSPSMGRTGNRRDTSYDISPPGSPVMGAKRPSIQLLKSPAFVPLDNTTAPPTPLEAPVFGNLDVSTAPMMTSPKKTSSDEQMQQQISSLLESIPARIRLTSEPESTPFTPKTLHPKKTRRSITPSFRSSSSMSNYSTSSRAPTPSFTLAPAYSKTSSRPRPQSNNPEIKLYHLSRSTGEAPIKLFVRLVGEHGERVMVRVGGGWADLGEYLKEYASHHGRRNAAEGADKVVIQDLPSRNVSSSSTMTLRGASNSNGRSSPTPPRPQSVLERERPGSSLNIRKTRKSLNEPASSASDQVNITRMSDIRSPSTPLLTSFRPSPSPSYETPPSAASSSTGRSSSRLSWTDEDSVLGLAGPKGKGRMVSERDKEWVESMKEKVRVASVEKERVKRGEEKGFGEMERVGGTKRLFRKG